MWLIWSVVIGSRYILWLPARAWTTKGDLPFFSFLQLEAAASKQSLSTWWMNNFAKRPQLYCRHKAQIACPFFFSLYLLLSPPKSRIPVVVSNTTIVYTTRRLSVGSALSSWMSLRGADNSGGPFVPPSLFCSTANPELLATAYCLHHMKCHAV